MALRTRYMENGASDRYAYPYRTIIKPSPYIAPTLVSGEPFVATKTPGLIDTSKVVPEGTVKVVETKNGNGENVQIALDENGEVIATKKVPPNIVPIALAAAAAWFFLM